MSKTLPIMMSENGPSFYVKGETTIEQNAFVNNTMFAWKEEYNIEWKYIELDTKIADLIVYDNGDYDIDVPEVETYHEKINTKWYSATQLRKHCVCCSRELTRDATHCNFCGEEQFA